MYVAGSIHNIQSLELGLFRAITGNEQNLAISLVARSSSRNYFSVMLLDYINIYFKNMHYRRPPWFPIFIFTDLLLKYPLFNLTFWPRKFSILSILHWKWKVLLFHRVFNKIPSVLLVCITKHYWIVYGCGGALPVCMRRKLWTSRIKMAAKKFYTWSGSEVIKGDEKTGTVPLHKKLGATKWIKLHDIWGWRKF